jgi:type II secretory pathway pseudopilin PulG
MAALLVGLAVMALVMSAAMPMWQTAAKREREAELVFRGEQYARAIQLFQRKYANALPASVDTLVNEKFLRRKYRDPITNGEFRLLDAAQAAELTASADGRGGDGRGGRSGRAGDPAGSLDELGRQTRGVPSSGAGRTGGATPSRGAGLGAQRPGQVGGGIVGVSSQSGEKSLREYRGRGFYNQWAFVPVERQFRAGGPPGTPVPGTGGPPGTVSPPPVPPGARRGLGSTLNPSRDR